MTVAQLQALLKPFGITPVRDRGQHFLLDEGVVTRMIAASEVKPADHVLEIGPGPGILTAQLLETGAAIVAAEIDIRMIKLLNVRFAHEPRLHILAGDVRTFSNAQLAEKFPKPGPYKIVANLPYGITTEVFLKFMLSDPRPQSLTLMIQREVADRVLAKPGDMSAIAVFVQTLAEVRRVTNVPANAFFPPPKVDSSVIHIVLKHEQFLSKFFGHASREKYFAVVRAAFASKRKQLKNTLLMVEPDLKLLVKALASSKISPQARPEELSVDEWRRLANALVKVGKVDLK